MNKEYNKLIETKKYLEESLVNEKRKLGEIIDHIDTLKKRRNTSIKYMSGNRSPELLKEDIIKAKASMDWIKNEVNGMENLLAKINKKIVANQKQFMQEGPIR